MKAVMISIRPEWCVKIANGQKTIEVRKTRPNLIPPFKCYIYCTHSTPYMVLGNAHRGNCKAEYMNVYGYSRKEANEIWGSMNGKVIGEFVCDDVTSIGRRGVNNNFDYCYESLNIFGNDDIAPYITAIRKSCIRKNELNEYAKGCPRLFCWHISHLKIYDKPMEIGGFIRNPNQPLLRPPQSWCYIELLKERIEDRDEI